MNNPLLNRSTILWADDDPDEIALMREVLHDLGSDYNIIEANNGRAVLDYLQQARETGDLPCLVVLDLNMPVLNGKETLTCLKNDPVFENLCTVVLTTSNSYADKQFCERLGTEMLTKPLTYAALKQTIQTLLSMCDMSVRANEHS